MLVKTATGSGKKIKDTGVRSQSQLDKIRSLYVGASYQPEGELIEKKMTKKDIKKRDEIADAISTKDMKDRYGDKNVKYAIATKIVMDKKKKKKKKKNMNEALGAQSQQQAKNSQLKNNQSVTQRLAAQKQIEDAGNTRATTTTTTTGPGGKFQSMEIKDAGLTKDFQANAINNLGKMGGAKLEMDSGGLVPNVGKFVQDVGKNALAKNSTIPSGMKGELNKGLANTAQKINQETPGTDAFRLKTAAMQVNQNTRKKLNASYNMDKSVVESDLIIQDWKKDDIKYTEIEAVDIIKPQPIKPTPSNWRDELDEDWQKVNRKDKTDGLSKKAVKAYRRENPGSKLKTAVTKDPKKLKKGSKDAKRRLSFCRRMKGMKKRLTSAKTARDPDSRINKALRRWNC